MIPANKILISTTEYEKLRYETSKDILSGVVTAEKLERMDEVKQRKNLVASCLLLADALLEELGYIKGGSSNSSPDKTSVRSLKDLMGPGSDK